MNKEWDLPSKWSSMLVFRRFFALATSLSVTLVQRDILPTRHRHLNVAKSLTLRIQNTVSHSPFQLCEAYHVADGVRLTHRVDSPQPRVRVAGVKRLEAVAQVPLACHLCQSTGQILRRETECNELIWLDTTTLICFLFNRKRGRNTDHTTTEWSVPVPDKRVGHHERDGVRMRPTYCLHRNRYVSKWHLIIADSNLFLKKSYCKFHLPYKKFIYCLINPS